MAADAWSPYNQFKELIGRGVIKLDTDAFNLSLHDSTSNAATLALSGRAALTGQLATANGYTQPGSLLTSVTWVAVANDWRFDSADKVFTAAGGSLVFRFAVIDDDTVTTPVANPLCVFSLLDNAPADITVTDTNTGTIQMNVNGILVLV